MGGSEGGDGGGIGVDCSVGTIVWVRRRNGSWWPGRILGQEELSASHLMSPRSGTPVKLLGREDASVDWYNLEKSKRVKAFRCGEFDACIEKAEASLGVPIKKREKYARREDAILHALELESKQLELKQPKQAIISNGITSKPLGTVKIEFNNSSPSDKFARNDESSFQSDCAIHKAPLIRKPGSDGIVGGTSHVNGDKSNLAIKSKRSHGGFSEESSVKKRDRRRPLVQVLQTSAKIPPPHSSHLDCYPYDLSLKGEQDHMGICQAKQSSCIYLSADSIVSQHDRDNSSEETQSLSDKCGFNQPGSVAEDCSTSEMSLTNDSDTSPRDYLDTEMEGHISGGIALE